MSRNDAGTRVCYAIMQIRLEQFSLIELEAIFLFGFDMKTTQHTNQMQGRKNVKYSAE
jgi:hypothetical protein